MENQVLIQKTSLAELRAMISDTLDECLRPVAIEKKILSTVLTRQEAAKMLHVSLPTLHFWTKEGIIRGTRIGSSVRYRLPDIEAAMVDMDSLKYKRKKA